MFSFITNVMLFAIWHKCLTIKNYVDHYQYPLNRNTLHLDRPNNLTFLLTFLVVGSAFGSLSKYCLTQKTLRSTSHQPALYDCLRNMVPQYLRVPHEGPLMVEPDPAGGDEAQGARVGAVLCLVDAFRQGFYSVFLQHWYSLLEDDRAGVHALLER